MEVIINNCTGVGMRARLCTLYGVYIYARQGRKRRTIVLLRCEKLNHKQRVAHNNEQYSCVLTMMMWHSAELWIGCCSCFCCCWWTMKYTATPDIKPNQNWTKHNCHWEHTIIIEVQRKDGTLRKRIHTDRQKTITAAAAASKDKKIWFNGGWIREQWRLWSARRWKKERKRRRQRRRIHVPTSGTMQTERNVFLMVSFVIYLFIVCLVLFDIAMHASDCHCLVVHFTWFRIQAKHSRSRREKKRAT